MTAPVRRIVSFLLLMFYAALAVAVCMAFAQVIRGCQVHDCGYPKTWLIIVLWAFIAAPGLVVSGRSVVGCKVTKWDLVMRPMHSILSIILIWVIDFVWYEGISFITAGYTLLALLELVLFGKKLYRMHRGPQSISQFPCPANAVLIPKAKDSTGDPEVEAKSEQLNCIQHYQDNFGNIFSLTAYHRIYEGLEPTRILIQIQGKTAEINEVKVAQVVNSGTTLRISAETANCKLFDPLIVNLKFRVHQVIERVDYNLTTKSYTYYLGVVKKYQLSRKKSIGLGELGSDRKLSMEMKGTEGVRQVRFSLPTLPTLSTPGMTQETLV